MGSVDVVVTPAPLRNWAGNITFGAAALHRPSDIAALQDLVAASGRLRVLGTGHSFSPVADTTGVLVSLADLPPIVDVDTAARTVRVSAGTRFGELAPVLHAAGLALPNTGSLPHISVAGAFATGTHGSGDTNQVLAATARAVELVGADGALRTVRRGEPDFAGSVVALGTVGVVTALELDLVPTFDVRQWVYEGLESYADVPEILAAGYSVSLFGWYGEHAADQVWVKARADAPPPPPRWFGMARADGPRHMVRGVDPRHCTQQGGVAGPWHERLPHFRLEFTPSNGAELQSEYLIPRAHAVDALDALWALREHIRPVLQTAEIRSIAADEFWLSAASGRDSVGLHFTWVLDHAAVEPVLGRMEAALAPFAARPHWGKVFTTEPGVVAALWPRLADAAALARRVDPAGTFGNAMLERYLSR